MDRIAIAWTYIAGENMQQEIAQGCNVSLDNLEQTAYVKAYQNEFFKKYRTQVEIGLPLNMSLHHHIGKQIEQKSTENLEN